MTVIAWCVLTALIFGVSVIVFTVIDHAICPDRDLTCRYCARPVPAGEVVAIAWPDGAVTPRLCVSCAHIIRTAENLAHQ